MKSVFAKASEQEAAPQQQRNIWAEAGTRAYVDKKPKIDIEMKRYEKRGK